MAEGPARIDVLIVEDHPGDLATLKRWLRHMTTYEAITTHAACIRDAEEALSTHTFDLALLDYSLCDGNGTGLIPKLGDCPAILVSSLLADDIEVEAMRLGASACIEKDDMTPRVIENTIRLTLTKAQLQSQLKAGMADKGTGSTKLRTSGKLLPDSPVLPATSRKEVQVKRPGDAGVAGQQKKTPSKEVP